MRSKILSTLLISGLLATVSATANAADAGEALAQGSGCLACHKTDTKLVGPSYKDVAKKYKGDATAQAKLVAKVKKGGAGVWGTVPMPPQAQVKDADLNTIVKWILTLK